MFSPCCHGVPSSFHNYEPKPSIQSLFSFNCSTSLLLISQASSSGPPCPFDWLLHKSQCYLFSREKQDRQFALRSCSSNFSQLADTEDPGILVRPFRVTSQAPNSICYFACLDRIASYQCYWDNLCPTNLQSHKTGLSRNSHLIYVYKIYAEKCTLEKLYICEKKASC
uniref:Uncharacterized protein n=1 Tax=Paramormyrops kingsleyae TaxID=1676925 RepID=A0A3B3R5K5_9TELE